MISLTKHAHIEANCFSTAPYKDKVCHLHCIASAVVIEWEQFSEIVCCSHGDHTIQKSIYPQSIYTRGRGGKHLGTY